MLTCFRHIKQFISDSLAIVLLVVMTIAFSREAAAQGNLLVNPKRVVFEGQKKTHDINLANTGQDSAEYVVSFIQIRMTEDGRFEEITVPDSGQNFASDYLRVYPKKVRLAPNESQLVKVQLKPGMDMAAGEYRSHLYFRAVSKETAGADGKAAADTSLSIRITPVFGISIPVIIRQGVSTAEASISDIRFEKQAGSDPAIVFKINRTGNMSVYGDIQVKHVSKSGKLTDVGLLKGISVYSPVKSREVRMNLTAPENTDLRNGKFVINYVMGASSKDRVVVTAEHPIL